VPKLADDCDTSNFARAKDELDVAEEAAARSETVDWARFPGFSRSEGVEGLFATRLVEMRDDSPGLLRRSPATQRVGDTDGELAA